MGALSPTSVGGTPVGLHLYVPMSMPHGTRRRRRRQVDPSPGKQVLWRPQQHGRGTVRAPLVHFDPRRGRLARRDRPPRRRDARTEGMISRDRAPFSAIVDRPPLACRAAPASSSGQSSILKSGTSAADGAPGAAAADRACCCPTCRTGRGTSTAWGRRLAVPRSVRRLGIRPTLSINARVCKEYECSPARRANPAGSSWATATNRARSTSRTSAHDRASVEISSASPARTGRLARSRPHADLGDARTPRGGRNPIHRRLGLRRRADRDPHRKRAARHAALFGGANDISMMIVQHHESAYFATA